VPSSFAEEMKFAALCTAFLLYLSPGLGLLQQDARNQRQESRPSRQQIPWMPLTVGAAALAAFGALGTSIWSAVDGRKKREVDRSDFEARLNQQKVEHAQQIEDLKARHSGMIEELKSQQAGEIGQLREQFDGRAAQSNGRHSPQEASPKISKGIKVASLTINSEQIDDSRLEDTEMVMCLVQELSQSKLAEMTEVRSWLTGCFHISFSEGQSVEGR
jgi:hypothetical protein